MPKFQNTASAIKSGPARTTVQANPVLKQRLKELMEEQKLSAAEVTSRAGVHATAVYDIMSDKSKNPSPQIIQGIAQALSVTVAYLKGQSDDMFVEPEPQRIPIPIIGTIETATWRKMCPPDETDRIINGPPCHRYRDAPHIALDVGDDSMNALKPVPILRGATVYCVELSKKILFETGSLYAISFPDKDGKHETVLRRAYPTVSGFELRAETTFSRKYPPIPVMGTAISGLDTNAIVRLVYGLQYIFDALPTVLP